eukprot:4317310-Alexandrium_andersonii.AAC.1
MARTSARNRCDLVLTAPPLCLEPDRGHPVPVLGQLLPRRGQADTRLRGSPVGTARCGAALRL